MLKVDISKTFQTFKLNVSFTVPKGLIVLFGPSGCGKSSTLDAIAGILTPDRGEISIEGITFLHTDTQVNLSPQKRQVGYVFQTYALFPHLTVAQNIGFGLNHWTRDRISDRVKELLDLFQLTSISKDSVQQISGGQAQRVALARAIAPYPKLLLLDEPFNAVNYELRMSLRQELKSIQRHLDIPVILVTHSRSEAIELGAQVVIMEAGQVKTVGNPNILMNLPVHPSLKIQACSD